MKAINLIIYLLAISIVTSCSLSESIENMQKTESKIRRLIESNTDCHEISLVNFKISNGVTEEITYKLVGCEYETLEKESGKIMAILKDSINGFCEAKYFNLIFKGKLENRTIKYWKCELSNY